MSCVVSPAPGDFSIISRLYAKQRVPDPALRAYLLQLPCTPATPPLPHRSLTIADLLPDWFHALARHNGRHPYD